jgi:hypothetical protein
MELVFGLVFVALILLFALLIIVLKKRKVSAVKQMDLLLSEHKLDEVRDIIIPDGIGGLIEIEHIILLKQGVLLVQTHAISGNLFGAEKIDDWTQIMNGRSFKFPNPLRRVRTCRQALSVLMPNVPIFCRVLFTADTHFPKGKPDEVSVVETLDKDLEKILSAADLKQGHQKHWEKCMRIARHNGQAVLRQGDE